MSQSGQEPDDKTGSTDAPLQSSSGGVVLPFDRIVRTSLKSVTIWTTYLGGVFALVVAYNKFGSELGITSHLAIFGLGSFPILVTVLTHTLPTWRERQRISRVEDYGKHGQLNKPGYFRLTPYEIEDRDDFRRSDLAHKSVLAWIKKCTSPVLYLSGASGTGKSSLLNAWVLPELQAGEPPYVTLTVRTFADPVNALVEAVTRPSAVWKSRPADAATPRGLLEKACEYLSGKPLLIVLDQFEEFLILHDEETRRELQELLSSLSKNPIPGLTVLLSMRSEYLGQLDDEGLPAIEKGETWMEISPFNLRMSQQFLDDSGLELDASLRYQVLTEATTVEGTQGLIRPITLNMFGVILNRFSGRLPRDVEPGTLLLNYVRRALNEPDIKSEAPDILREMITSTGAREPQSEEALVQATGHKRELIRGALLALGNQGIVRRIDATRRVWEVSHDFIAGMLGQLLVKAKKPASKRAFVMWLAPVVVVLWFAAFWFGSPFYLEWRHRAATLDLGLSNVRILVVEGGYSVYFPDDTGDLNLNAASYLLTQLKHPVLSVSLRGAAGVSDLGPLAGLTGLQSLDLRDADGASDLGPLAGLTGLRSLDLSFSNSVSDLGPLAGLTGLRSLDLSFSDGISDLGPLAGLTSLRSLGLTCSEGLRVQSNALLAALPKLRNPCP